MASLGYDDRPWPMKSSCRYEQGTPKRSHLTYYDLRSVFTDDENAYLNFMVDHSVEYYEGIKFTDLSRRLGISVHRVRAAVDNIRLKLEYVDAGVPLKDLPVII